MKGTDSQTGPDLDGQREAMQRTADAFRALGAAAAGTAEQMQPKPPAPMNRADRRARQRAERRAGKLAIIQAATRGIR